MNVERRFSYAQHRQEEAFLEGQYAKGFRLVSKRKAVYTFEETAPLDVEYLIEMPEPGTDIAAWEAYREYLGFIPLFVKGGQHYLFRESTGERFEKRDHAFRQMYVQSRAIRRMLRMFFFVILAFAVYLAPVPPETLWLKVLFALFSVFGLVIFALQTFGDLQLLKVLQDTGK